MKYVQQSGSNKQRVEWWLSGARRRGDGACLFEEYKVAITQDKYIIVFLYNLVSRVNNIVWYTLKIVRG